MSNTNSEQLTGTIKFKDHGAATKKTHTHPQDCDINKITQNFNKKCPMDKIEAVQQLIEILLGENKQLRHKSIEKSRPKQEE